MNDSAACSYPVELKSFLRKLPRFKPKEIDIVARAYERACAAHEGQKRRSGEPYFSHCVAVAEILAELQMDVETIAAALLHDVVEDTDVTLDELQGEFGPIIARLVDYVTKANKLPSRHAAAMEGGGRRLSSDERNNAYLQKMLMSIVNDDERVILVKLADRLHNMRTLAAMPSAKRLDIARETMDFFAPLANYIGTSQIKAELEDLSFQYLNPREYRNIARFLDVSRKSREAYIARMQRHLEDRLRREISNNISVSARPKHIYSIYQKMKKKDVPLEQIYDVRGLRVLVDTEDDCYRVLGIVHGLWDAIPGEFDDYIGNPKGNYYRSLHTAVRDRKGTALEVQIRTHEMHHDAEFGVAAHWRYKKEGEPKKNSAREKLAYNLKSATEDDDSGQIVNTVKSDIFQPQIQVYTPNGDVIELPEGATPIDFAYKIHTEVGHGCRGAKVDGRMVPLHTKLKSGNLVEILTAKRGGPNMDWLDQDKGYTVTSRARSKIRQWLRRQDSDQTIPKGRRQLERALKLIGALEKVSFDAVARLFGYSVLDDFLADIGTGTVTASQVSKRVLDDEQHKAADNKRKEERLKPRRRQNGATVADGVHIRGTRGLLTVLARCCNPILGDDIIGYTTRGRGVTVHRKDCSNILSQSTNADEAERLIDVSWDTEGENEQYYPVPVDINAFDREGLLEDISAIIREHNANIAQMTVSTPNRMAKFKLELEVPHLSRLTSILAKIGQVPNVIEVYRRNSG